MRYFFRVIALGCILLMLLSCTAEEPSSVETTTITGETETTEVTESWYVPEDEWQELETQAYHQQYADVVSNSPHGSPDPTPGPRDQQGGVDLSRIEFQTNRTQYSKDDEISFRITYLGTADIIERDYVMWQTYALNMERWNGDGWERLIDIRYSYPMPIRYYQPQTPIDAGESVNDTFPLDSVITVLTPGKYRLVAYINYQPIYAEFELVE